MASQTPHPFSIGARVRAARALAGFTKPEDLRDELVRRGVPGLGRTVLYAIESDRRANMSVSDLREIAEACGLTLEWFTADFQRLAEISPNARAELAQTLAGIREVAEGIRETFAAGTTDLPLGEQ